MLLHTPPPARLSGAICVPDAGSIVLGDEPRMDEVAQSALVMDPLARPRANLGLDDALPGQNPGAAQVAK